MTWHHSSNSIRFTQSSSLFLPHFFSTNTNFTTKEENPLEKTSSNTKKSSNNNMASLTAVSMATPITTTKATFFSPLPIKAQRATLMGRRHNMMSLKVQASLKEKAVTGMTAAALTAYMMVPDVAEAAELPPSLKNLLLSVVAGGVVLFAIIGAIVAVSNFDPVKRV